MPIGDTERAVSAAAALDGIQLVPMPTVSWLNTHGHFALPEEAAEATPVLQQAFERLHGDKDEELSKPLRALPSDIAHLPTRTLVEIDEFQHFTSFRAVTLDLLNESGPTADVSTYSELCASWSNRADRYRARKVAKGFPGEYSRGRQRAYNDLLRDIVAPMMGWRVVRIPAPKLDGAHAYADARVRLLAVLEETKTGAQ